MVFFILKNKVNTSKIISDELEIIFLLLETLQEFQFVSTSL